jgi:hypothetical protein
MLRAMNALRPAAALTLATTLCACAPKLVVRNDDPTTPRAVVQVDGELIGIVDAGDSITVRLDEGMHEVVITPMGSDAIPWTEDGEPWLLYLDEGAYITLFPTMR